MTDIATPELRALIHEQDQATLRTLLAARRRAEGPREIERLDVAIERLLTRLEERR